MEEVIENKRKRSEEEQKHEKLPLDWTIPPSCRIVFPWDIQPDLSEESKEVVVIGTHGQKVTQMGSQLSQMYPLVTTLILRSNLLQKMEGLSNFNHLEVLELYDNSIEALEDLNSGENNLPGVTLRLLDLSYNTIRVMTPVQFCPNLVELYLAQNKIKSISGLKNLTKLRKLELGANRIRVMDPDEIGSLINLEELWLGKNKIEKIQGLEKLTKLRRLDIQSNRLTVIENLSSLTNTLEELYLASNGITDEGLSSPSGLYQQFQNLEMLDLSKNKLKSTNNLVKVIPTLTDLWISGNLISSFEDIRTLSISKLEVIYLEFNEISSDFEYRMKLREIIGPTLKQIDADPIMVEGNVTQRMVGRIVPIEEKLKQYQEKAIQLAEKTTEE